jgi:hypothetical protein
MKKHTSGSRRVVSRAAVAASAAGAGAAVAAGAGATSGADVAAMFHRVE